MKQDTDECRVCGNELTSPLDRARGVHESCLEKNGGEDYIQK